MVKTFKYLLPQNQLTNDLETWYVALGTLVLPWLHKWWPWADQDLFYDKVNYGKLLIHKISQKVLQILALNMVIWVVLMSKWPWNLVCTVQPSTCFYQSWRVVACSGAWKRLNSTQFPRYSHADHTIFSRRVAPPPRRLAPTPRSVGIFRAYLDAARLLLDD